MYQTNAAYIQQVYHVSYKCSTYQAAVICIKQMYNAPNNTCTVRQTNMPCIKIYPVFEG